MSQNYSCYCDGIVRSTNTTYGYIIANDHYYDTPPSMVDMSMALAIMQSHHLILGGTTLKKTLLHYHDSSICVWITQ